MLNVVAPHKAFERTAAETTDVAGRVTGDWSKSRAQLHIAYGKRWSLQGDVAVNVAGMFAVPSNARSVLVYIDSNENGHCNRYAEPSGDCSLVSGNWTCQIQLRRATLQRAISSRNAKHSDQTLVFWEDFTSGGQRVDGSHVCIDKRCTRTEPSPFVSRSPSQVEMLSICGEEGFAWGERDGVLSATEYRTTVSFRGQR